VSGTEAVAVDGPDRFARALLVQDWDQDRLAAATAILVGVGALGNEVAKNLALAGVGRLVLCDPDTVSVGNLSRTVLFTGADLGRPKAVVAAERLRPLAPAADLDVRQADLVSGVGLGELAQAEAVLGCLDSIQARMTLLGRCALVEAPLVDGGTRDWGGEVRLRLSVEEPCYACPLGARERGADDLPRSCTEPRNRQPAPATIGSTAMIASWMTMAALRILMGHPPSYRLLAIDGVGGRTTPVAVVRDQTCPYHAPLGGPVHTANVTVHDSVGDLLATLPAGSEPLAWREIPIPARCPKGCGYAVPQNADMQEENLPRFGASSVCRSCGTLVPRRFTTRLRDTDAERSLADAGVAPHEILPVRLTEGGYQWCRLR
jgi:molybdopterin-synthase adenylyltransferase